MIPQKISFFFNFLKNTFGENVNPDEKEIEKIDELFNEFCCIPYTYLYLEQIIQENPEQDKHFHSALLNKSIKYLSKKVRCLNINIKIDIMQILIRIFDKYEWIRSIALDGVWIIASSRFTNEQEEKEIQNIFWNFIEYLKNKIENSQSIEISDFKYFCKTIKIFVRSFQSQNKSFDFVFEILKNFLIIDKSLIEDNNKIFSLQKEIFSLLFKIRYFNHIDFYLMDFYPNTIDLFFKQYTEQDFLSMLEAATKYFYWNLYFDMDIGNKNIDIDKSLEFTINTLKNAPCITSNYIDIFEPGIYFLWRCLNECTLTKELINNYVQLCILYVQITPRNAEEFSCNGHAYIDSLFYENEKDMQLPELKDGRGSSLILLRSLMRKLYERKEFLFFLDIFIKSYDLITQCCVTEGYIRLLAEVLEFINENIDNQDLIQALKGIKDEFTVFLFKVLEIQNNDYLLTNAIKFALAKSCVLLDIFEENKKSYENFKMIANNTNLAEQIDFTILSEYFYNICKVDMILEYLIKDNDEIFINLLSRYENCISLSLIKANQILLQKYPGLFKEISQGLLIKPLESFNAAVEEFNNGKIDNKIQTHIKEYCEYFSTQVTVSPNYFPYENIAELLGRLVFDQNMDAGLLSDVMNIVACAFSVEKFNFEHGILFFFDFLTYLIENLNSANYVFLNEYLSPFFSLIEYHYKEFNDTNLPEQYKKCLTIWIEMYKVSFDNIAFSHFFGIEEYGLLISLFLRLCQAGVKEIIDILPQIKTNIMKMKTQKANFNGEYYDIFQYILLMLFIEAECTEMFLEMNIETSSVQNFVECAFYLYKNGYIINKHYKNLIIFGLISSEKYIKYNETQLNRLNEVIQKLKNEYVVNPEFREEFNDHYIKIRFKSPIEIFMSQ